MKKLTTILMGILCLLLFSGSVLAAAPQSLRVAVLPAVDAQGWLDEDVLTDWISGCSRNSADRSVI